MPAQRLFESVTATASPSGVAVFNMPVPPTDLVWIGTLTCPTAPITATFFATVAGSQWCSWAGQSIGGPVQAYMGEQVQVTAAGLTAGVTFQLQWIGRSDSVHETGPAYPDTNANPASQISSAPGTAINAFLLGGAALASATAAGAATTPLLAAPPSGLVYYLHNATFTVGASATNVQIVGHSTGFVYAQDVSAAGIGTVPLMGQIAAEALDVVTIGGGGSCWLSYDFQAPFVPPGASGGFVLEAQGTAGVTSSANTFTFSLPGGYITKKDDAVFIAYSLSNIHPTTFSGLGGTWTSIQADTNQTAGLAYAYGCAAGQTQVTATLGASSLTVALAIAVYSGVLATSDPIGSNHSQGTSAGVSVSSIVNPVALAFNPSNLVIAASSIELADISSVTWSNGATDTQLAYLNQAATMAASLDAAGAATVQPMQGTAHTLGSNRMRIVVAVVLPAP